MDQTRGSLLSFSSMVLVMALLVLLVSQGTQGCQCPSCHFASPAQNCQCCVFRQLGKRSDPAMTHHLAVPSNQDLSRYLSQAISNDLTANSPYAERVSSRDWSPKRHPSFYYNDVKDSSDVKVPSIIKPKTKKNGYTGLSSFNPKMFMQFRLLENIDLASALDNADDEGLFGY